MNAAIGQEDMFEKKSENYHGNKTCSANLKDRQYHRQNRESPWSVMTIVELRKSDQRETTLLP